MEKNKATVYAYVGHNRGVVVDFEGKEHRNEWVKLNLELGIDEVIEKLSWRAPDTHAQTDVAPTHGGWGSNNVVLRQEDLNRLVGKVLTLADAMIGDNQQRDAWKSLLRSTIHEWHDEKFSRYQLELDDERKR